MIKMKHRVTIDDLRTSWQAHLRKWINSDPITIKISSILKILYLPAGIFVYKTLKPYSYFYLVILYILFSFNTLGATVTIDNEKTQPLENLYFISSGCIVIVSLLIGRYHENYLWTLYQQVIRHQESAEFVDLANTIIRERIKLAFIAVFIPICFIIAVPLYAALFTEAQTDDFIVLIYPMWYPWKRDTTQKYVYSLILQYLSVLYAYYLLTFVVGSFVCASLFIYIRFTILERRIFGMEEDAVRQIPSVPKVNCVHLFHRRMKDTFASIVRDHQDLVRFTRQTIKCFTLLASILVTYATTTAVLLITLFLKTNVSTLLKVKLASTSIVAMVSLVVCCFCGELLSNLNNKLMDAIYHKPWYTYSIELRTSIVIFMIQSQARYRMKLFGMFPLCISYIAQAFKLLYSCIQFLRRRASS